jgi:hypothetical protein
VKLGTLTPTPTGSWNSNWQTLTLNNVAIAAGTDQVLRLEFSGGDFNIDNIEFQANIPPVAHAGVDQKIVDADKNGSELVSLDGSVSTKPGGTITQYSWKENNVEIASGVKPSIH